MDSSSYVTLVVEGSKINCSKRKLAQHSNYFKTMFEGCFIERNMDVITMDGVDVQSLKICLSMLENRELVPRDEEDLALVLQTACMLQFEEISEFIGNKLLADLDVTNCFRVWFLTEPLNLMSVSLKAKKMALVEFNTIKDLNDLLKLTKEQLHQYLANVHLVCNEFDVFSAFMNWHNTNGSNVMDVLACLDFNRLSNKDIENMMWNIHATFRKGEYENKLHLSVDLARKVLNCNRRGSWMKPRFFKGVESEVEGIEDEVAEEDVDFWKALKFRMCSYENQYRYTLTGNKKLITLRRDILICATLRIVTWNYDCVQKHWDRKYNLQSYFWGIPDNSSKMKLCYYKNKMFVLDCRMKCAYHYISRVHRYFQPLNIMNESNFPTIREECTLHRMNDRILVKDSSQLVELRVDEDDLLVEKVSALLPGNFYQVNDKSVPCHYPEYTVRMDNNLLTLESEMIFLDQGVYRFDTFKYVYDTTCEMLWPDDSKLSGRDEYVNTIENLFGESSNRC